MENIEHWEKFKKDHGKTYADEAEEKKRLEIFMANFKKMEEHNKKFEKGEVTWTMGVNQFSDLLPEEMHRYTGLRKE